MIVKAIRVVGLMVVVETPMEYYVAPVFIGPGVLKIIPAVALARFGSVSLFDFVHGLPIVTPVVSIPSAKHLSLFGTPNLLAAFIVVLVGYLGRDGHEAVSF